MTDSIRFANVRLVHESEIVRGDLCIAKGKIIEPHTECSKTIDCQGLLVTPGFIDLQVNGLEGNDLTTNLERWSDVAKGLCRYGVTSFLATVLSQPLDKYFSIVKDISLSKPNGGANCLGLHLEGPHLHAGKRGAHTIEHVNEICDLEFWKKFLKNGQVKMMTLAPELTNAIDLIQILKTKNIIASCGHTDASFSIMEKAEKYGLDMATHLYNGMSTVHHRKPGPVGYILGSKKLMYSIICDGIHVHPIMVKMAYNAHPNGMILVSDANAGLYPKKNETQKSSIAGRPIEVFHDRATLEGTDVLAGSICSLNIMVYNLQKFTGCSLQQAIATVTVHPAKLLGQDRTIGRLLPGYDADFVVLDANSTETEGNEILATYVKGQLCYCHKDFKNQDFS